MKKIYYRPLVRKIELQGKTDLLLTVSAADAGLDFGGNAGDYDCPDPDVKGERFNVWDEAW